MNRHNLVSFESYDPGRYQFTKHVNTGRRFRSRFMFCCKKTGLLTVCQCLFLAVSAISDFKGEGQLYGFPWGLPG